MKITPAVEGPEPPQKIIALLARLIKRTPADVEAMLCTGAIRLAKVLVSTDMEKMVSILRRNVGGLDGKHHLPQPVEDKVDSSHSPGC